MERIRSSAAKDSKGDLAYLLRRYDALDVLHEQVKELTDANTKLESILASAKLILSVEWQHLDITLAN